MKDWRSVLCSLDSTIREGIRVMDGSGMQICIVVDGENKLRGVVTDGDVRRGILRGIAQEAAIGEIMNTSPTTIEPEELENTALEIMLAKSLHHLPVVDREGRVIGLKVLDHLVNRQIYDNIVVLMAGGLGTRLGI